MLPLRKAGKLPAASRAQKFLCGPIKNFYLVSFCFFFSSFLYFFFEILKKFFKIQKKDCCYTDKTNKKEVEGWKLTIVSVSTKIYITNGRWKMKKESWLTYHRPSSELAMKWVRKIVFLCLCEVLFLVSWKEFRKISL